MASLNKVTLIGNLGTEPEFKTLTSGQALATFSLATNESYKDANGQPVDRTEWHRIVVWGKLAEICKQYLNKGKQIYIEGKLQTRSWDDKDGQKRYTTEIVCNNLIMLGSKSGAGSSSAPPPPSGDSAETYTPPANASGKHNDEDDLPF